jgi:hypothetical protein
MYAKNTFGNIQNVNAPFNCEFLLNVQIKYTLILQGLTGRAFERAKEVDEKCRNENQVDRGEHIMLIVMRVLLTKLRKTRKG